jgi:hypothetical protein
MYFLSQQQTSSVPIIGDQISRETSQPDDWRAAHWEAGARKRTREASMSHLKRTGNASAAATSLTGRAQQAAARMRPLATSTRTTAGRGVHKTRGWAAPQIERTGKVLEDRVAPRISAMLTSAAQRIEPAEPRQRRWAKLAGISILTTAASAIAAVIRHRSKSDLTPPADTTPQDVAPDAEVQHRKPGTSTKAPAVDGHVRTS